MIDKYIVRKMSVKVYIINLKRARDRKRFMTAQLEKLGLDFEFIEAHDSQEIYSKEVYDINNNRLYDQELTKGEIAAALSHAKVYKALAKEKNYNYGLIVEDDVLITKNIKSILSQIKYVCDNEDIVLLFGTVRKPVKFKKIHALHFGYSLVGADNFDGVHGAGGYFISKEKAINLSEVIVPIRTIADDWKLFLERGYFSDIKIVYPFPVLHAELLSLVNENNSKRNLRTRLKYFMYCNKVFPFYTLFLWRRRNRAEKMQKKYINAPEFLKMKTYKL